MAAATHDVCVACTLPIEQGHQVLELKDDDGLQWFIHAGPPGPNCTDELEVVDKKQEAHGE